MIRKRKKHTLRNLTIFLIVVIVALFVAQKVIYSLFPCKYTTYINRYSNEYHLDRYLVMGIIKTESNFDPKAVSGSGAKGLMQLTDATAAECSEKIGLEGFSPDDIYDPETNIRMGCFYLSYLIERFDGEVDTALAAYNAGEGKVREWLADPRYSDDGKTLKSIPFPETAQYNKKIRTYQNIYKNLDGWYRLGKK